MLCSKALCCMQATSDLVRAAISHVRQHHPFWNATNGADHFMVFSYDHGKCEMARALRFEDFGGLFSVQAYGSLVYRWAVALLHAVFGRRPTLLVGTAAASLSRVLAGPCLKVVTLHMTASQLICPYSAVLLAPRGLAWLAMWG